MNDQKHLKDSQTSKSSLEPKIVDDNELKLLEKTVLGTGSNVFFESLSEEDSDNDRIPSKKRKETKSKEPAWVDEDDISALKKAAAKHKKKMKLGAHNVERHQTYMKEKYQEVVGIPKWSKQVNKEDSSSINILNTCGKFIKKPEFLKNGVIEIKKLKDLNFETHTEGPVINVVKFHSKSTVGMVAGLSGIVSLFQVDGKQNSKLLSIHFKKYPIHCGTFLRNGEEFLIGSQHYKFFYCHNLIKGKSIKINNSKIVGNFHTKSFCVSPNDDVIAVCGNFGKIYLFSASTKEYIDCFQMNCEVTALDFNQNGSHLYSHGEEGEVYIWDMNSRTCIKKFYDDGCVKGTAIGVSLDDQLIACGSDSGVVNIYNGENIQSKDNLLPFKTLYNLTTPITSVKFNASCELLAMASNLKKNAIKLIHCPTMTTFSNFPAFHNTIKNPNCLDFSPNSGFFSVGDSKGSAHLFRLKYFGNY